MTDTFFPTSTPAMAVETMQEIIDRQSAEIINLKDQANRANEMREHWMGKFNELHQRIANVKGHLFDMYSMNGEIDDDVREIARLLDITLLKEIQGTATYEISWTAQVPLDFDADDFEISFDVNCDTYEAEDFDYNEVNTEVDAEDV